MISDITKIQEAPAAKPITSDSSVATDSTTLLSSSTAAKHPQEEFTLREKLGTVFSLLTFDPKKVTSWAYELH
jgi:hypothetical protein